MVDAFKEASDTKVGVDGTMMTKTDGNAHIVQVGVADLSTEPSTHVGSDGVVPSEMLTNPITQVRRTLATLDPHRTFHPLQSRLSPSDVTPFTLVS